MMFFYVDEIDEWWGILAKTYKRSAKRFNSDAPIALFIAHRAAKR